MKIVVTGALGHIGSKLIRELPKRLSDDAEVLMIDNFRCQRYVSLFNLPEIGHYTFVEKDVTKDPVEKEIYGANAVIHLAAITDASNSFNIKEEIEQNNYTATLKVAEICQKLQVPMIFISTTSVYGTQSEIVDEDCSEEELKPQSPYAETKLREEKLLQTMPGLQFIICRFGTICGASPGMRFHTAVNKFCWQASCRVPITVWKTALHQKRPYLVLDDAIDALLLIIKKEIYDNQIYNILSENSSVNDIISSIKKYVPSPIINFVDSQIMNQLSYNVLDNKFRSHGFESKTKIEQAIIETLELLKNFNTYETKYVNTGRV
jgi:UDP-glucose 4-epimerase